MNEAIKAVRGIHRGSERHWVGDGFPVRTVFSYQDLGPELNPFILLDHAGPADFDASPKARGVDWHPHRGFETVTVVFDGEVDHEDTAGNRGSIGPGDVQWMTAGSGVLHKEFHGGEFARNGGRFEVLQLWVNLPAKSKMATPRYQGLTTRDIAAEDLPDGAGRVRVIAGEFRRAHGPARTFTPINLLDVRLQGGKRVELDLVEGWVAALFVRKGKVSVNGTVADAGDLVVLEREGAAAVVEAQGDAELFVMNGEPIDEPIAGYGPFVMNTPQEIQAAFSDYRSGKFGKIPAPAA